MGYKKYIKAGWRISNYIIIIAQILRYVNDYRSMIQMKATIGLAKPKLWLRKYSRFCTKKVNRYKHITSLSEEIEVLQLQALLLTYLNLSTTTKSEYRNPFA